jgi:geranylgeranyl reductase family protein
MKFDFAAIVVGAGPAGSEFAYQLSTLGHRVLVLEKRALDREKPCGGGIQVQELVEFGTPPADTIERKITEAVIVTENLSTLALSLSQNGHHGITVRRSLYDRYLQKRAVACGATIVGHQTILDVNRTPAAVDVAVRSNGTTAHYRAPLLVHAGGFNCQPVDRRLGIRWPLPKDLGITFQLWFALPKTEITNRFGSTVHFFFDENFLPRGYVWAFPKQDVVAVGLGTTLEVVQNQRLNLKHRLWNFIEKNPMLHDRLAGARVVKTDGGCIPLALQPDLAPDNAILLGDAGGFGNIIHGGGIYQARKSALIARDFAHDYLTTGDKDALRQFDRAARTHFYEYETKWDKKLRPFLQKNSLVKYLITASQDGDGEIKKALAVLWSSTESHQRAYEILEAKVLDAISQELTDQIESYRAVIETELKSLFPKADPLSIMVNHTLLAQAKRLRSALVMISCEAIGRNPQPALPVALAYELSHTASLVHDDIIDGNTMRRGRKTLHHLYGLENAIIAGDALLIKAFELLQRYDPISAVDKHRLCHLIQSGCGFGLAAASGQTIEIKLQQERDYRLKKYLMMVRLKTGSLIEAATEAGGIIGGASAEKLAALTRYGRALGIAFQIVDDSKDLLASEAKSLKAQFNDLRLGKPSPMLCHCLVQATPADKERLFRIIGNRDLSPAEVAIVLEIYRKYDSITFSQRLVKKFVDRAQSSLKPLPDSPAKAILGRIVEIVGYWSLPSEG